MPEFPIAVYGITYMAVVLSNDSYVVCAMKKGFSILRTNEATFVAWLLDVHDKWEEVRTLE